jgi:hypothetical protein
VDILSGNGSRSLAFRHPRAPGSLWTKTCPTVSGEG